MEELPHINQLKAYAVGCLVDKNNVDDVLNVVRYQVWKHEQNPDKQHKHGEALRRWLLAWVRFTAYSFNHKTKSDRAVFEDGVDLDSLPVYSEELMRHFLHENLKHLSDKCREAMRLMLEGWTQTEAADILGITQQSFSERIQRGLEEIKPYVGTT